MDIFAIVLWPIKWAIEAILVGFHWLFTFAGLESEAGFTWVLSIAGLVVVVRAALIPVFVRQIKNQRKMLEISPDLKKIQDKYKGKKDQFSREAMSRDTMAMYKKHGTNPLSSCLPILLQMPIFFGLFSVLNSSFQGLNGVGFLDEQLSQEFGRATLFGIAPLGSTMVTSDGNGWVIVIAAILIVLMTASQFITQLQIMSKNQSPEMKASPMFRQQRILLYLLPIVFLFSGIAFPLGVMFYWFVSNIWTMVQQFIVIRNLPTPGSEAALAREARLDKQRQRRGIVEPDPEIPGALAVEEPKKVQRAQPINKNRSKKKGGR
jgi:YidC/Oxa1 family membrane protein insertase